MKNKVFAVFLGILLFLSNIIIPMAIVFVLGVACAGCVRTGSFLHQTGFVANTNTNKIHDASCKDIKSISKENRVYFDTYDEAKEYKPYVPCQDCMPDAYWEYVSAREIEKEAKSDELDYYSYKDYKALQDDYDALQEEYNSYVDYSLFLEDIITISADIQGKSYDEFIMDCLVSDHPIAQQYMEE